MQRSASQALRFKLRVAVHPVEDHLPQFKNPRLSVQQGEVVLKQFVVLVSPYDAVSDLRRVIVETYAKLYPGEPAISFGLLKDAQMFDIDESFVVGEVFEPSEVVKVVLSSGSSGLFTPKSNAISPVESAESVLVCPAPKLRKMNPEDLLANEPLQKTEPVEDTKEESEEESEEEEEESKSEEGSDESEETEESESESEEEAEEAAVIPSSLPLPSGRPSDKFESIDEQIAAHVESEYSSSELEVNASSSEEESEEESSSGSESEESGGEEEAVETTVIVATAPVSESSSEYESTSEEEEAAQAAVPAATITPQASSEEETESESESEEESGEEESESDSESEAEKENKVALESSSSSSDDDESADELVLPAAGTDVKQVLKRVPKYTSLTSLNDCLSQAVSGRATPLLPKAEAKVPEPVQTKGRVRLPRRKTNNSGYDASLFS